MAVGRSRSGISALSALLFQGGIGVVGLVAILVFGIPVQNSGLSWLQSVTWGCLGAVGTYGVLIALTRIPGLFPDNLERQMKNLHDFAASFGGAILVVLSVIAGVGEELLFRGAVQGWLTGSLGETTAIAVASLLFGLVHYISFTYFLVATGLGLLLGTAYALSDSLSMVMIWHAVYDMVALFCLLRFPHWFGVSPRQHP
ncbi:type II CAAX endopeptidase family protein [Marinobacter sp. M216]|uniref:Type II CAAX endopeptidase family protein n=1 Tax=Marinobacter albus TaxID=3030833 RepID=A0ABT7HH32_9GAMM|nr:MULTISPECIES: type II CAAX endopeptidase family protein [unclassified Marinobacter]MBW7472654.1 CPBP family intramembrane metalloprotease [Marinobacter sp. F4218]MDK9559207.1 type II CAAX endopeptidase family protein [Marinobacter sp. M216]